ncbi:TlpA family protein disulfide reductase [Sphaerotilus mobilis]|uniref:Thiol-disulfide isomerase/thioredoxin n=1 Tax=Sphaerotilus mobilis TaxID=47994 RepID=A0A4Q7LSP1_9BURK|nr:TlpA disulfide reductase family protein [Sphaerotilus mobilis]RZS56988.1 thiol-disulfide isomerase/thioredoxin [Sphaerotilus mobilis]
MNLSLNQSLNLSLNLSTDRSVTEPTLNRRALLRQSCGGAVALAGLPFLTGTAQAATVGSPAPALSLPSLDGTLDLASSPALKGRVVLVDFWASWCGPCRQSFPWMNLMQQRHGPRGLQIVAVNVDRERADADAFLRQFPPSFRIAFDASGDTPRRWGARAMPTSVLVGADGRVLLQHEGFRPADQSVLESAIVQATERGARG